jgi:hypothetical protein
VLKDTSAPIPIAISRKLFSGARGNLLKMKDNKIFLFKKSLEPPDQIALYVRK